MAKIRVPMGKVAKRGADYPGWIDCAIFSNVRRSFLVGRPAPFGRKTGMARFRSRCFSNSAGSVKSSAKFLTKAAETLFPVSPTTRSLRLISCTSAEMISSIFTAREGLTVWPSILTFPFRQASAASDRVLKSRTAQSHLSSLTDSSF
jgi:hypothetical protein